MVNNLLLAICQSMLYCPQANVYLAQIAMPLKTWTHVLTSWEKMHHVQQLSCWDFNNSEALVVISHSRNDIIYRF